MKDITDYFSSPVKVQESTESPIKAKQSHTDQPITTGNKVNTFLIQKPLNEKSKKRKKKRKHRPSDPEVRVVSELLSSNLSLISPNTSNFGPSPSSEKWDKEKILDKTDIENKYAEPIIVCENSNSETALETETPKDKPKVNAFQFLMNSRNSIIGQNSEGKTVKETSDQLISDEKEKLVSRKNLFTNWANKKGAAKRQREEEEIENTINFKMKQRAKKFKKMLNADKGTKEENNQFSDQNSCSEPRKRVWRLISSDSESSLANDQSIPKLEDIKENAEDVSISSGSCKKQKESGQNNILSFLGAIEKKDKVEIFDCTLKESQKEIIKIKMFTPESTKKRISAYSLKREREITLDLSKTDESSQESIREKKHIKKKKKKTSSNDTKAIKTLNNSTDDFCSPEKPVTENKKTFVGIEVSTNEKHDKMSKNAVEIKNDHKSSKNKNSLGKHIKSKAKMPTNKISQKTEEVKKHLKEDQIILSEKLADSKNVSAKLNKDSNAKTNVKRSKLNSSCSENKEEIADSKDNSLLIEKQLEKAEPDRQEPEGRNLRPKRNKPNYRELFEEEKIKPQKEKSVKKSKKSIENKDESIDKIEIHSDSDIEEKDIINVPVKVAPVFLKATPKPKLDHKVIEARKQFLLSGVPDSIKKNFEKQKSFEDKAYEIFPTISHVTQKCTSSFWNLPKIDLNIAPSNPLEINPTNLKCQNLIVRKIPYDIDLSVSTKRVNKYKTILNKIKSENPNYPVYKVFRHINEKSGKHLLQKENKPKSKKSPRKKAKIIKKIDTEIEASKDYEMWTEKYKPRSSEEILGNYHGLCTLKKWLETWMLYSEEINAQGKRKKGSGDSESDFESTDCDSRDSTRLPGNTIILGGPCGCGKSSAVYAIANELGLNVLEVNGSTKRTGKKLIQELQEATQSHQVRKHDVNAITNFINQNKDNAKGGKNKNKNSEQSDSKHESKDKKKKMCILLVEDVDLVFDQDEGFLASLSQLITTSKRPIVLTTTDTSPPHVQKLLSQYECISFMPLSLHTLAVWLQVLCLVEGYLVDKDDLGNFLEYNNGDIRKTMLQVQFWCQSGGLLEKDRLLPVKTSCSEICDVKVPDEDCEKFLSDEEVEEDMFVHKQCIGSFEVFRENEEFIVPYHIKLGTVWWNIPNILAISCCSDTRLNRHKNLSRNEEVMSEVDASSTDKNQLGSALRFYDSLVLVDGLFNSIYNQESNEPIVKNWTTDLKDSSDLTEREDCCGLLQDLAHDISHSLINGHIVDYQRVNNAKACINMALPDSAERRWRAKQHMCENFLKEPIPLNNVLDRPSVALDYLPSLRDIARFEDKRAALNTKRGNRFRHYLKNLNMDFKDTQCKFACNILNLPDETL